MSLKILNRSTRAGWMSTKYCKVASSTPIYRYYSIFEHFVGRYWGQPRTPLWGQSSILKWHSNELSGTCNICLFSQRKTRIIRQQGCKEPPSFVSPSSEAWTPHNIPLNWTVLLTKVYFSIWGVPLTETCYKQRCSPAYNFTLIRTHYFSGWLFLSSKFG